ncbi:hypothetical protein [Prevotella melaninogenica]|uniref:hypothetical protein n=1 Tax=Prevotella melaninogenica TaxID=28132 RepID=UPI001BAC2D84|nr:hypothetical protein [Prevotella melaninogenica]QUB66057.1 hypothetical protein J5A57_02885 [Prevotella melaninogenica]
MSKKIMFNDKFCLTKAVLDGTKTMTRRKFTLTLDKKVDGKLIRVYPSKVFFDNGKWLFDYEGRIYNLPKENYPRYGVGEVVAIAQPYKDIIECLPMYSDAILDERGMPRKEYKAGWTNKMFVRADLMPRHIQFTDVKVERLQDISDDDIMREGIRKEGYAGGCMYFYNKTYVRKGNRYVEPIYNTTPMRAFASLIYKVCGGETWESNPPVVAYSFELVD